MPSVILGEAYTPTIPITDSNGSAVITGVIGTMSLYFANGTSTTAVASGAVAFQGGKLWGYPFTAANLANAGLYYARTGSLTGTVTLGAHELAFTVGELDPDELTLRELIEQCVGALGIGVAGTTTSAGSTTTLVDTRWADTGLATNEFVGDEVLILEPGAVGDTNPVRVTASNTSTGTLTFTPAVTSVGSGVDYLLLRPGAVGVRYDQLLRALRNAIRRLRPKEYATDEVSLTAPASGYTISVPRGWREITQVWADGAYPSTPSRWVELAPRYWQWEAGLQQLRLDRMYGTSQPFRIGGYLERATPQRLTDPVPGHWTRIVDDALGELGLPPRDRATLRVQRGRAQRTRMRG